MLILNTFLYDIITVVHSPYPLVLCRCVWDHLLYVIPPELIFNDPWSIVHFDLLHPQTCEDTLMELRHIEQHRERIYTVDGRFGVLERAIQEVKQQYITYINP
jgi:hypothetical protein